MDKDSYNIDSILSEVKKRREENEREIKARDSAGEQKPATEKRKAEPKSESVSHKKAPEHKPDSLPQEKIVEQKTSPAPQEKSDKQRSDIQKKAKAEEDSEPVKETSVQAQPEENDMVDILQFTEEPQIIEEQPPEPKSEKKKMTKGKKTAVTVIIILVILLIGAGIFAYVWAQGALNKVTDNKENTIATTEKQWSGMDVLAENFEPIQETEATELASLQDMIKTWYYNGVPCSSSHVLNVMLIGEDTRGEEILDEDTRADAAIIASINIDTKEITLTSILRDTYAYWETTEGDKSTGQFGKINGAMSTGDINAYINCVENMYKIDIDNYVIVNFDSFESIVDALGGVTLELTSAEINEINSHQKRYGNVTIEKTFEGNSGELKLTGKQALAYCRIRKLDSDNARADRQKTCLVEIFNQAKDASNVKLLKIVNSLIPYVNTGFNKSEIVQIAKYAFSQGWLGFDINMTTVPEARINEKGAGGIFYGAWCWKSDFPQDAYNLQTKIYGKSSITLAHIRVDVLNCRETGFYSDGYSAVTATITNNNYGEVTTLEASTEDETTTSN
ncbi:MAG: LCP family protein [Eubacterium sp.]